MTFQVLDLEQGSEEWLKFRRKHNTGSEAAIMLGLAPSKMKRNELLKLKKLGTDKEFSGFVQRFIFEPGHAFEASARKILSLRVGDLFAATGINSNYPGLSVSLDGITMMEDIIFEHKQLNKSLAESIDAAVLPDEYMPQVQQGLMLTGAEKCIFVCSDGTLDNWHEIDVYPSEEWFKRIVDGWNQFNQDLDEFEVKEEVVEPIATTIDSLPSLNIVVSAEVQKTNLPAFRESAKNLLAGINLSPKTDQEFADAEETVKFLKSAEERIDAVKSAVLSQTEDLDVQFKTLDDLKREFSATRLKLDKTVKAEKENRKSKILNDAHSKWNDFIQELSTNTGLQVRFDDLDFSGAIKGKRLLTAMEDAVDTLLANSKIEAKQEADRLLINLETYKQEADGYEFLFNDFTAIIYHPIDALKAIIKSRIAEHKVQEQARLDSERERIRIEEEAKAQAKAQQQEVKAENTPPIAEQKEVATANKPRLTGFDAWIESNYAGVPKNKAALIDMLRSAYQAGADSVTPF